jgi:hypothetical protein
MMRVDVRESPWSVVRGLSGVGLENIDMGPERERAGLAWKVQSGGASNEIWELGYGI